MSHGSSPPGREQVIAMLATFGDRLPKEVGEQIGSLEMVWLLHCVEQRYGVRLDFDSDEATRISSVSDVVGFLHDVMTQAGHG
jgi:hypothetical protein